ncbi:MAG: hypothetical protein LBN36_05655 [Clostridiales Family XIII bacterium]|jgi:hypothetical protein|nr:hypothetical protein [Clostridiales Family XIII bacterium]
MKTIKNSIIRVSNNAREMIRNKSAGMELVQVAILIAIAIVVGLIFRNQIKDFVDDVFSHLSSGRFL